MTTHWSAFGTALREARLRQGKSQAALAKHLGVSAQHLSLVEGGHRSPLTRERTLNTADFLGADPVPLLLARGSVELPLSQDEGGKGVRRNMLGCALSARWDNLSDAAVAAITMAMEGRT